MLSRHPEALQKARQELDEVFGRDPTQTAELLRAEPALVNKLLYLAGVIKEVLRLYPAASTVRMGQPGYFLEYDGVKYPTEGKPRLPEIPMPAQS